jgi:hypothetical protein
MVGPLRRQCENDFIDRYSWMLALVFIPMGRKKSNPMFAGMVATVFSNNMAMPKALSFVVLVRSPIDQDGTVGLGKNRVTALLTLKLALLPSFHQTEPRLDRLA